MSLKLTAQALAAIDIAVTPLPSKTLASSSAMPMDLALPASSSAKQSDMASTCSTGLSKLPASSAKQRDMASSVVACSDGGDSDGDLITEKSDATRLSKSRSNASRCKTTKAKKREAFLAHCKKKYEASGKSFSLHDQSDFQENQKEAMLAPVDELARDGIAIEYSDTKPASECVASILTAADGQQFTLAELMSRKAELDAHFMGKFVMKPTSQKWIDQANTRCMKQTPDGWFCTLCDKYARPTASTGIGSQRWRLVTR